MVDLEAAAGGGGDCLQVGFIGADYEVVTTQRALDHAGVVGQPGAIAQAGRRGCGGNLGARSALVTAWMRSRVRWPIRLMAGLLSM